MKLRKCIIQTSTQARVKPYHTIHSLSHYTPGKKGGGERDMEGGGRRKERTADRSLEKKVPTSSSSSSLHQFSDRPACASCVAVGPPPPNAFPTEAAEVVVVGLAPAAFLAGPEIVHYHASPVSTMTAWPVPPQRPRHLPVEKGIAL